MDEEKHSQIVKKNSSKETLSEVKEKLEIEDCIRQHIINKCNDYFNLIITKVVGLGSLAIGVLKLLVPSLIPNVLAPSVTPFALISVGMAFLLNKKAISSMRLALKLLAEYDEEDKQ